MNKTHVKMQFQAVLCVETGIMEELVVSLFGVEVGRFMSHVNPLQYSCLDNSVDRGTWQAIGSQTAGHD